MPNNANQPASQMTKRELIAMHAMAAASTPTIARSHRHLLRQEEPMTPDQLATLRRMRDDLDTLINAHESTDIPFRVGQVWRRADGSTVTIGCVLADGDALTREAGRYCGKKNEHGEHPLFNFESLRLPQNLVRLITDA